MSEVRGTEPSPAAGARVFFQTPALAAPGSREESPQKVLVTASPHKQQQPPPPPPPRRQHQGKVTVKYDRKELRKRLVLEEWIVEQLSELYGCEEEEMPEVEIDIDDLLEASSEEERILKLQESLVDCYKPTEEFINQLLSRIRGMRKLSPPQRKDI
ncbi:protein phosphatase 1 regulatory inhibitor subunit 14C L homeolog isoform X1 [Xenopus laevis]|uniref:MGC83848 protein n=1 Tax=Xenopus laevis TaxID=8355 RepID=Q640Z5_XENLA|nr:protein phosphatase 1 regulatory inhibitor subunit 14C L homeolog [Xenopus laevis]XP_041418190.1 protein phosphatase 1 regulatory inhibitor subunit 14C L homeolog isoform X1 [Xenopus laevis]AAH82444.1 MGC83848 protein [Xenopus laevis]